MVLHGILCEHAKGLGNLHGKRTNPLDTNCIQDITLRCRHRLAHTDSLPAIGILAGLLLVPRVFRVDASHCAVTSGTSSLCFVENLELLIKNI